MPRVRYGFPIFVAAGSFFLGIFVFNVAFLPPEVELGSDGFRAQLGHTLALFQEGADVTELLYYVHLVRLGVTATFLALGQLAGSWFEYFLMLMFLLPLVLLPYRERPRTVLILPFFLPLLISGRSVLAAISIGYVILFLAKPEHRSSALLLTGAVLANLSSASVLVVLLLLSVGPGASRAWMCRRSLVTLCFLLLSASFYASLELKISGFLSGDSGYEAHAFSTDSLLFTVLSRSTLLVSLVEGQYLRAVAYATIAVFVLTKLLQLFVLKQGDPFMQRVLLCCAPALLMEGLGVVSLIFPIVWIFAKYSPDRSVTSVYARN